jgi:predicted dehydrogenase
MPRVELLVHSIHYLDCIRAVFGTPKGVLARSLPDPRAPGMAQTRTSVLLDYGDMRRGVMSINHNHQGGRQFQSAWFRIEGTNGEADELWFCPNGGEWGQVPLTGSWFIEAFMGTMRNLQRFDAGEDTTLFSGVEDAFHSMALVEACFASMALPSVALQQD